MANTRSLRRLLSFTFGALATVLFLPLTTSAAEPRDYFPPEAYLNQAREAETRRDWAEACTYYDAYLATHRNDATAKQRFLFCLRNFHRGYRHGDADFQYQLLHNREFKFDRALEFYKDVLTKVQQSYFDDKKTSFERLFREGVEELYLSLDDENFRKAYVGRGKANVQKFREQLRARWVSTSVTTLSEVCSKLKDVADAGWEHLRLNPRAVVLEFACGACNALDEYSFYVPQGRLAELAALATAEKSVVAVDLIDGVIGYIQLAGFQENTLQEVEAAHDRLRAAGMKVLVLDLRGNAGGSVKAAVQVVERFLPAPYPIATTSGKMNENIRSATMNPWDVPMMVLIDGNTASAAELVAAALKTRKQTELVGQATFGKNQVQKPVAVAQAPYGVIRLTWTQFYPPDKQDLSRTGGVAPTVPVAVMGYMGDRALEVARDRAKTYMMR